MNTNKLTLRFGALAFVLTTASVFSFAGCGGDDTTDAGPTPHDSGTDSTKGKEDSGKEAGKEGKEAGKGGDKDVEVGDDAGDDGGDAQGTDAEGTDAPEDTTISCTSDASTCNSCYDDAQAAKDPYNACSPYTKYCVPFTTTVPTHPKL